MKKLILSAFAFSMFSVVAFAQDVPATQEPATTQEETTIDQDQPAADVSEEMRSEVSLSELPEAITNELADEKYQEWTPTASYKVVDENETEHYAVELQKEDETKTVTFDSEGNKIDKD